MTTQVEIEITFGDIKFQLVYIKNGYDGNPSNDEVTIIPIPIGPSPIKIPYALETGPKHALSIVGSGRKGAELTLSIPALFVNETLTVDNRNHILGTILFNVY